jgi:hypothetical protein
MRNGVGGIRNRQQFDEETGQLHDMIFSAPCRRMAIACAHRESKSTIKFACRAEVVYGMDDVVETSGQGALGARLIEPTKTLSAAASCF